MDINEVFMALLRVLRRIEYINDMPYNVIDSSDHWTAITVLINRHLSHTVLQLLPLLAVRLRVKEQKELLGYLKNEIKDESEA